MANSTDRSLLSEIPGHKKASIFMLALGETHVGSLLSMMHEDEVRALSEVMAKLGVIPAETVEHLCTELVSAFGAAAGIMGTFENTENLLMGALPKERVAQIMEEIRGPAGRTMWDKLGNVSEEILAAYLRNEYPQTVAVVLSMIKADHSARVLTQLPDAFAVEVILRLLRLDSIQRELLERVEKILRAEFMSNFARSSRQDSYQLVAEIFNGLDAKSESRFLAALEERNREAAERVKAKMFTFGDLEFLSPSSLQTLLRQADRDKLPVALKGTSESFRNVFLNQMSKRAAQALRDEIEGLGPVKVKDVEDAQSAIANLARTLAATGEIEIGGGGSDSFIQ